MPPASQPQLSGPTPEIKAILVTSSVNELNAMLDKGWKIVLNAEHGNGCILIMARNPVDIKIK